MMVILAEAFNTELNKLFPSNALKLGILLTIKIDV